MDLSPGEANEPSGSKQRMQACDTCRSRKTRCDGSVPCSFCQKSGIPCRYTRNVPEKRQRVLISPRYEQEIASVNERLVAVEQILRDIQDTVKRSNDPASETPVQVAGFHLSKTSPHLGYTSSINTFEGNSSFAAQLSMTTQVLQSTVRDSVYDKNTTEATVALTETVNRCFGPQSHLEDIRLCTQTSGISGLKNLPMISQDLVLKVLRYCEYLPQNFFLACHFIDLSTFAKMCQAVYFPMEDYALSTFIIVNIGLYNILRDLSHDAARGLGIHLDSITDSVSMCISNADTAILHLSIVSEPSLDTIISFLLSAQMSMGLAKHSLAWKLISSAATLCLEAGYHQLSSQPTVDNYHRKKCTFWFIYAIERGISLNFGRNPILDDDDITTPRPSCPGDLDEPLGYTFLAWLNLAELQGETYRQLYSGRAQKSSIETKINRAESIAGQLLCVHDKLLASAGPRTTEADYPESAESFALVYYSVLTIVYNVIPSTQSNHPLHSCERAVSTARIALNILNRACERIEGKSDESWRHFIHWTVLFCPFVPYLVVFGNVVATRNDTDLPILRRVVRSLEIAAKHSPPIKNLYLACKAFLDVGRAYLASPDVGVSDLQTKNGQQCDVNPISTAGTSGGEAEQPIMDDTNALFGDDGLLSQQEFDELLNEWDMGIGAVKARQITGFLGDFLSMNPE